MFVVMRVEFNLDDSIRCHAPQSMPQSDLNPNPSFLWSSFRSLPTELFSFLPRTLACCAGPLVQLSRKVICKGTAIEKQ